MALTPERRIAPPEWPEPICPLCEQVCDTIYRDRYHAEIVGCDRCVEALDADSVSACFPPEDESIPL